MNFENLNNNEIYPIPSTDGYLVYAPLSGDFFSLNEEGVSRLEQFLAGDSSNDKEAKQLLQQISDGRKITRTIARKKDISQIHKLTILPTYQCNFKCSYCYSSHGRASGVLSYKRAKSAIDYFINPKRTKLKELWLAILGGGRTISCS